MTLNKVCSNLAFNEGKKSQVKIGDIRELMKVLVLMIAKEEIKEKHSETMIAISYAVYEKKQQLKKKKAKR